MFKLNSGFVYYFVYCLFKRYKFNKINNIIFQSNKKKINLFKEFHLQRIHNTILNLSKNNIIAFCVLMIYTTIVQIVNLSWAEIEILRIVHLSNFEILLSKLTRRSKRVCNFSKTCWDTYSLICGSATNCCVRVCAYVRTRVCVCVSTQLYRNAPEDWKLKFEYLSVFISVLFFDFDKYLMASLKLS